jgi:hypothetical protein
MASDLSFFCINT